LLLQLPAGRFLADRVISVTLKRLSDTRLELKSASVKYDSVGVHEALTTLAEIRERHDPDIAHKAITVSQQLKDGGNL
jgi:hypothetical protein